MIPQSLSTITDNRYPDKAKLLEAILTLRAEGMSYREIARIVGIHFTWVQQILRTAQDI
jgi:DNA-directed RNA polymerase specialized sigma24 family protein